MDMNLRLSNLTARSVTLVWDAVEGADYYIVSWSDRDTPAHIMKPLPPVRGTSFVFQRSTDIPYYLSVEARSLDGAVLAQSETVRSAVGRLARPQLEELGRGLIAVATGAGVFLSWRLLRSEVNGWTETGLAGADFVVYKNGEKLAVVTDRTSFRDERGTAEDTYAVAALCAGVEEAPCKGVKPWKQNYIDIPLSIPESGVTPAGQEFTYHCSDMSVGDMDGDGEYEFVLKWSPSNAHDVSHRGYTGHCILDCCRLDGTRLWRLDMGPNIRAGNHYTQFMVYDFNGDGRAEMAVKTAPGTLMTRYAPDGSIRSQDYVTMPQEDIDAGWSHEDNYVCSAEDYRRHVADMFEAWPRHPEVLAGHWPQTVEECLGIPRRYPYPLKREEARALADFFIDQWAPARDPHNKLSEFEGFIYEGPEYLTMFDGTGRELDTIHYEPARGDDGLMWGDYAWTRIEPCNRVDRFLAGVGYLDGERPYLLMCRGYYTRAYVAAYDFFENKFHRVWAADSGFMPMANPFDYTTTQRTGSSPTMGGLAGQGNHSISTADIDGDGYMELIYGAAVIDHDGTLLYSARGKLPDGRDAKLGHGDAMHVADIDPDRPGKEIFNVYEEGKNAPYGYALRDAETGKVYFGQYYEGDLGRCMIGDIADGVRGLQVWVNDVFDCKGNKLDIPAPSTNMRIFWAGDMTTQLTDGPDYLGQGAKGEAIGRVVDPRRGILLEPEGTGTNHYTKATPCLVADIFGDWREEILLRHKDNTAIRIYTNTDDAPHKLFTLMHDPQYRCGVAWQNNCYNQPVYPSFYYASDMAFKDVLRGMQCRPTVYLAGDSTMQSCTPEDGGLAGWGQTLSRAAVGGKLALEARRPDCPFGQERQYTLPEIVIDNCAMGGRSTRQFIAEGRLEDIERHITLGDYLIVQFGHNDCDPSHPERYTTLEEYAANLEKFIRAARDRGAAPVLVTPITDLGLQECLADLNKYSTAMLKTAERLDVPVLDMRKASRLSLEKLGARRTSEFFEPDGVHLTPAGAAHVDAIFVNLLKANRDPRLELLRAAFGG